MDEMDDKLPGAPQIRMELNILLARSCLRSAPSQAAVLEVVVKGHLNGETLDGNKIGDRAFPNFIANYSSDVRVNVKSLRKTLKKYYEDEGTHDSVIIEIGEGRNYPVTASYNPTSDAVKYYQKALAWMGEESSYPWLIVDALAFCRCAIDADPTFAPAYALYSEYFLCLATYKQANPVRFGHGPYKGRRELPECIGLAREYAIKAVRLNKNSWRAHVAMGAYRACCYMWKAAARSFKKACELSFSGTTSDPWYSFFLIAVGRYDEALKIVEEKSADAPRGSFWNALRPLFLYLCGDLVTAHLYVRRYPGRNFITMAVEACLYLARAKYRKVERQWALGLFDEFFHNYRGRSIGNPIASLGLWALMCGEAGEIDKANQILNSMLSAPRDKQYEPLYLEHEPGLGSTREMNELCENVDYELRRSIENRRQVRCDCPWELGLAFIGAGLHDSALMALEQAQKEHHPMMIWLHQWWFLRPLHKYPKFSELVIKMKLPGWTEDEVRFAFREIPDY